MNKLWPKSLAGQMIAGNLVALTVAQIITFAVFIDERRLAVRAAARTQVLQRTASVVRLLENTPRAIAEKIATQSSDPWIRFSVSDKSAAGAAGDRPQDWALRRNFRRYLNQDDVEVRMDVHAAEGFPPLAFSRRHMSRWFGNHDDDRDDDDHDGDRRHGHRGGYGFHAPLGLTLSVRLNDRRWLNVETLVAPPPPTWALPTISMAGGTAVALIIIVIVLVRRAAQPLQNLAVAADRLGRGEDVKSLPVSGPSEVRQTTEAFNEMRERLQRFVKDRTQMLAAISHDLRTPITALRLRAEFIDDKELQAKILRTLAEMQAITEATLAFAREDAETEASRRVDLASLIESLCADLAETGLELSCSSANNAVVDGRPAALRRAFGNLIENAVTYGQRARIENFASDNYAVVTIEDDGAGIPAADRERIFEPFVRLEESRSRETGGIGLGLAIARTLIRAHGGDIELSDASSGGLRVTVTMPLSIRSN